MQTQGGAAAEAAITAPERVIRASVQVDWNGDGLFSHPLSDLDPFIESVKLNKALQGSAPEELILVEGTSVAELSVVMAGEGDDGISLAHAFSPYNTQSQFYGKQVVDREIKYTLKVETDSGLFEYPQFIGNIRTISPDRADNSVEITALDKADKTREPTQLPPYAVSEEHIAYGEEDSQLVRSQWVIEHALAGADCGPSDKRPTTRAEMDLAEDSLDGVQMWVSGNGSYLPSVGWLDNLNADTFPNPPRAMFLQNAKLHPDAPVGTPNPYGFAGLGSPVQQHYSTPGDQGIIRYWVADQDRINVQACHYLGFTLNTNGTNATAFQSIAEVPMIELMLGRGRYMTIFIQSGVMRVRRYSKVSGSVVTEATSANLTIPTGQSYVDCMVMWDATSATGSRLWMKAGANTSGWSSFGSVPTSGSNDDVDQIKGRFTIGQALNSSNFFYATRNSGTIVSNDTDFVYRTPQHLALLDNGLNRFTYMPSSKKQEAWGLIQSVVEAEWGSAFFDERGVFHFWNWSTVSAKRQSTVRSFSMDQVEGLKMTNSSDSVRNVLAVTTKKKRAASVLNIYKSSDVMEFYTPAYTEKQFVIWKDDVVSPLTFYMQKFDTDTVNTNYPNWTEDIPHGFCIQYLYGSGGPAGAGWYENTAVGQPDVRAYFTTDGYLMVRVNNESGLPIRFASGGPGANPSPAFHLAGTPINDFSEAVILYRNDDSIRTYGAKPLELSGDWYQDTVTQNQLFSVLLERTKEPSPATDAITVAGDPRVQLADCVEIVDKQGFGSSINLQILGLDREYTLEDGLTDIYTVEVVPAPGEEIPVDPTTPVYITRRNLCPNPAALINAKDFYNGSGRVTGVTGLPRTTAYQASSGGGISLPKTDVIPGKTYKMSAHVKSTSSSQSFEVHIDWYSKYGYLDSSANQTWSVSSGGVVRATCPAAVAPVGASKGFLVVASQTSTIQISGILYEEDTSVLGTYFDGDSAGAVWDGAQGNSQSRITEAV